MSMTSSTSSSHPDDSPRGISFRDLGVAAGGASLGLYLIVSSGSFPAGLGSLPGPGFFPFTLGLLIVLFSGMIAWEARSAAALPRAATEDEKSSWKLPVISTLLLAAWLLVWPFAPFLIRTPFLIAAIMRLSGSSWRAAILAAIAFTALVYAIFQLGLRVDLG